MAFSLFSDVGFIGCGSMGGALARCAKKGLDSQGGGRLLLAGKTNARADALAAELCAERATNADIAEKSRLIFIGVKPRFTPEVLSGIAPLIAKRRDRFILVSMVAGLSCARVRELSGGDYPVIRIMPNTACTVGAGVMQICALGVEGDEVAAFCDLMRFSGHIDEIPEALMDAASAVSGCGPAFLCLALEGMADGGVAVGLPRDKALLYAAETLIGLGRLAAETGLHPGVLKDQVTSPGGTTIQGVRSLEAGGVRSAFMEAVIAAYEKTAALTGGM